MCQIVTDKIRECAKQKRKYIVLKEQYLTEEQMEFLMNFGFKQQTQGAFVKEIRNEIVMMESLPWQNLSNEDFVRIEMMYFPLKVRDLDIKTYITIAVR